MHSGAGHPMTFCKPLMELCKDMSTQSHIITHIMPLSPVCLRLNQASIKGTAAFINSLNLEGPQDLFVVQPSEAGTS